MRHAGGMVPASWGRAVFCIDPTDVIVCGSDLADYFHREFVGFDHGRAIVDECPIWP